VEGTLKSEQKIKIVAAVSLEPTTFWPQLAVLPLSQPGTRQPCSEQPSEARLPRGNGVLYVMNINKKLSYCWETVRRESMPRIAEMDVEMTT